MQLNHDCVRQLPLFIEDMDNSQYKDIFCNFAEHFSALI